MFRMKDFAILYTNLCNTHHNLGTICHWQKCLFINHFAGGRIALPVLKNGTLHASFGVGLPSEAGMRRPERAGHVHKGSNPDRCFWVAGELSCALPDEKRADRGEHTA